MRVPGTWRLSAGGVLVPPAPTGAARRAEIARIRSSLREPQRNQPKYAPDSNVLWTAYFERRHEEQIAATNGVELRGRLNSEGRRQWWGVPGRTLEAGNTPRLEYPVPPSFSCRRGSSWTPQRMETATSSSSGSDSLSSSSPALRPVKPEPQETPLGRRTRGSALVINEGGRPSPSSYRLVRPKTEPGLLPVKKEHEAMAADDETAVKWAKANYVCEQMERQRRAFEEIGTDARRAASLSSTATTRKRTGRPSPRASATLVRGAAGTAAAPSTTATMAATTTPGSTGSSACRRREAAVAGRSCRF